MANLVPKVNNTGSLGTGAKKWGNVHTRTLDIGAQASDLSLNSNKITNLATPLAGTDAANKAYVDDAVQGLSAKDSVRVATTEAETLNTDFANGQQIDGVTIATGDRILIKNQAAGAENGIYTVNASGAPTRAVDFDSNAEVAKGAYVFVEEGTVNANAGFVLTTDGAITLGTTALAFTQFSGAGQTTAGDGLAKTGNTLSVDIPGSTALTGDVADADALLISDTSDSGALKKIDFSVVRDAVFNDISGDATVAAGGALSLVPAAITGLGAKNSVAANDLILISDSGASNALKKMTRATFVAGLGVASALNDLTDVTITSAGNKEYLRYNGSAWVDAALLIADDTTPQLGGSLDVNGQDIVSVSNGNITLTPNGSGVVRVDGTAGIDLQSGEIAVKNSGSVSNIKLYCENSNSHYTQIQSAAHATYGGGGNVTLTLPTATGILVSTGDSGTVTNTMLAGSIANGKLANAAVTVTAGDGLSGGGSVALGASTSLALDLNELTAAVVDVANDSIAIVDANDSNASKKESIADLVSGIASTGLSASGGQLSIAATVATLAGSQTLTNKTLTSAVLNTGVSGTAISTNTGLGGGSASDTVLSSQKAVKAYVDAQVAGGGLDIDGYNAHGSTTIHQTQDHFVFSSNGTEKKITFSNLEDAIFANVSTDATITGGGALTIAADAVTYAKMQNVSATDKILGRSSAGGGVVEEITCTAAGRALLDDVNAAAQRTTLGLGSAAPLSVGISDTNVLQANANVADDDFLRVDGTSIEGRSASQVLSDIGAQASDAGLSSIAGLTTSANKMIYTTGSDTYDVASLTAAGRALLDDADATAQRTTLGLGSSDSPTFAGLTSDNIRVGVTGANEIDTSSGGLTLDSAAGTVTVDDNLTVSGNASIVGNLTVSGTTTTLNSEVALADRFMLLNSNSTSNSPVDGGLVINVDPSATTYSGGSINIAFASATTVEIAGNVTAELAANKIFIVRQAEDPANNGLYQVHSSSHSGGTTTVTIKDASTNTPSAAVSGIVNTSFTANADDDSVVIAKTKIAVLKSDTANNVFEVGFGDDGSSLSYTDLATAGGGITGLSTNASDTLTIGANYDLIPNSAGTTNLGSASAEFGHIFIADDKKIQFGSDQNATIEYDEDGDNVLQIAGSNVRIGHGASTQLQFRDSSVHLSSDADGYLNAQADTSITLNVNGTDELALTSSTATFGGNLVIPNGGNIGSVGDTDALAISATGLVTVSSTSDATSSTTGALRVSGGLGVAKDLFIGDDIKGFSSLVAPHSTTKTIAVTVAAKSASHRYNGTGSSSGYKLDGVESPFLTLTPGRTYKFDQADSSNSGHPLRFYYDAAKVTAYTTGVTTSGTPGNSGAYTQIVVSDTTPSILHYQCSAHAHMGNSVSTSSSAATRLDLAGTAVTATGAELNILDGVTATATELNILDGVTATTSELNLLDGATGASNSTTILDSDRLIVNDGGIMKQLAFSDVKNYIGSPTATDLTKTNGNITIDAQQSDSDIIFKGTDGSSDTTFLTLDGSEGGEATFNAGVIAQSLKLGDLKLSYGGGSTTQYMKLGMAANESNNEPIFLIENESTSASGGKLAFSIKEANSNTVGDGDTLGTIDWRETASNGGVSTWCSQTGRVLDHTNNHAMILMNVRSGSTSVTPALEAGGSAGGTYVDIKNHDGTDSGLKLGGTLVTSTAAELNLLDGATSSTMIGSLIDTDRIIVNDGGTMKQANLSYLKTYIGAGAADDIAIGNGTTTIGTTSGQIYIDNQANGNDIHLKGTYNNNSITMLQLDASDNGTAIFNHDIKLQSDASMIKWGADADVMLYHVADTGLILDIVSPDDDGEPVFEIKSSGSTNNIGPSLNLNYSKYQSQVGDTCGQVRFLGRLAGNQQDKIYGQMSCDIVDNGTSYKGKLELSTSRGAAMETGLSLETVGSNKVVVDVEKHNGTDSGLKLGGTLVTSTAAEINILDGATVTASELNSLDVSAQSPSDNEVLTYTAASGLHWASAGGGGGSATIPDVQIAGSSGNVTAAFASSGSNGDNERVYLIDNGSNARDVTLPAISGNTGKKFQIKRLGSANVTVKVQNNEHIEGTQNGTFVLSSQYSSVTVVCNASGSSTGWFII